MLQGDIQWDPASMLAQVEAAGLTEEAEEEVRQALRRGAAPPSLQALTTPLAVLAAGSRRRRAALWQLDTRRARMRGWFAKEGPALAFDEGDVQAIFLQAFRLEGMRLALDLGKRPRPLLGPLLALPSGVGGRAECVDVTFAREPDITTADLGACLNRRLPPGLQWLRWEPLPGYASELLDLAHRSHWSWRVPEDLQDRVQAGVASFAAATTWPWTRKDSAAGVVLDLKGVVASLTYEDQHLRFSLCMGAHHALNPLKMLGALLGVPPVAIQGLTRTGIDLAPDPRLGLGDRFQPKLKNMYEDAVLLGGGSNITLVDEDDDEPLRLG